MPLDRTWYNTLVDDDGSGMTGSVWDKADVDALMDAIDAELAKVVQVASLWTPTLVSSGGGAPVYSWASGDYVKTGRHVQLQFNLSISSHGSLGQGSLSIGGLPFPFYNQHSGIAGGLSIGSFSGAANALSWIHGYMVAGESVVNLTTVGGGGGTGATALAVANIGPAFACMGSIAYVTY